MNLNELINELNIPSNIKPSDYPKVNWLEVDGNAFSVMGRASKEWKKLDRGVASRIASVCMRGDYDTLLAICTSICPQDDSNYDEQEAWLAEQDEEEENKYS